MAYQICELVEIDGHQVQRTRDATPEESAEIESRRNVMPALGQYEDAVQYMLDTKAHQFGYDDIKSACTYAGDPDPTFNDQGTKLKTWRSQCWRGCYAVMDQVKAGTLAQPTIEQLLTMLPGAPL